MVVESVKLDHCLLRAAFLLDLRNVPSCSHAMPASGMTCRRLRDTGAIPFSSSVGLAGAVPCFDRDPHATRRNPVIQFSSSSQQVPCCASIALDAAGPHVPAAYGFGRLVGRRPFVEDRFDPTPRRFLLVAPHEQREAAVDHVEQQTLIRLHLPFAEELVEREVEVDAREVHAFARLLRETVEANGFVRLQADHETVRAARATRSRRAPSAAPHENSPRSPRRDPRAACPCAGRTARRPSASFRFPPSAQRRFRCVLSGRTPASVAYAGTALPRITPA